MGRVFATRSFKSNKMHTDKDNVS